MSDSEKKAAAVAALEEVRTGMKIGLGTGSTADYFTRALGEKVTNGLDILAVPTSERTADLARSLNIPLTSLEEEPVLDLTVDGADELSDALELIKGGGGALLREKIVAAASNRMVVVADSSKRVANLGRFPLPIEVMPFGLGATINAVEALLVSLSYKGDTILRKTADGKPYVTDGGHFILDIELEMITEAGKLAAELNLIPGVVENGLFIDLADAAYVCGQTGVTILENR
ncbi:MAG: ribose-5-phosphate isomerase RpiA [Stappiaceae bacterium]